VAQWLLWRCLVPIRPNNIGMSPQRPAWCGSGRDGCTGLTVTGMTDPAGLTSRHGPASAQKRHSRVPLAPLRGRGVLAVRGRRHSVTKLTLALPHSAEQQRGWPHPRKLAKQRQGVIPKRVRVVARPCGVRALNACTRVREQVRAGAWERRAWVPSSGADPARGGARPSSEADLVRGVRLSPRARRTLSGIHPGYSCKEGRRVEDGLLL
jgi:hypothetical protein